MSQLKNHVLILLVAVPMLLSSCGKKFSSDNPLPSIYPPSVIVGTDNGNLFGYDYTTGKKNWSVSFANSIYASPIVYHGYVYVGLVNYLTASAHCDTLYKINSQTGKIYKSFPFPTAGPFGYMATPIADAGLIYIATDAFMNDSLIAVDTGTGAIKWRAGVASPVVSSPTIYKDSIIVATTGGTIYSFNKLNGSLNWSYAVVGASGAPVSFNSSPAVCDTYFYLGSNADSNLYSFKTTPFPWSSTPPVANILHWTYKTNGQINSSPSAGNGKVIVGSNDFKVHCVDIATGLKEWTYTTASSINSSPLVYNSKVYIGSNDYQLYALNILDGNLIWKQTTNGLIKSSPLSYKGTIYIGSYDKYFYAFDAESGSLKWETNVNGQMECSPALEDYSGNQNNSQVSGFLNY